jgi:type II secretory pathway component PulF
MKKFRYKALDSTGKTVQGLRLATNAMTLEQDLLGQNMVLLKSRVTLGIVTRLLRPAGGVKPVELRDFTLHMATCLGAGIPIIQALLDFEEILGKSHFRHVIGDLRHEINAGNRVAEAMEHHGDCFSRLYLSLIETGEDSGKLDEAFQNLTDYLEWADELRGKVKQALIYPSMLISAAVGLFLLMTLYVIPRFTGIFEELNFQLPNLTLKVLAFGEAFRLWWPFILGTIIAVVTGVKLSRKSEEGRYRTDYLLLQIPVLGAFLQKLALSRFARNFAMLFGAGIDILRVLQMLSRIVGNTVLARELTDVRNRVMAGESLSESFAETTYFPPLMKRMISVGENTGQLEVTMGKAAEYMDKDLPKTLKLMFTVSETILIFSLAGMIGVTALAMLLPIFSISGQITQ